MVKQGASPDLRVYLFGSPQIEREGEMVSTDRRKAVALLAYLLLEKGLHSREKLATLFWPETEQSRSLAYLRRTLWEINQMVGPDVLAADRETVTLLRPETIWLDISEFRRLTRPGNSEEDIAAGVGLVTDDFMAGFALRDSPDFDGWQQFQAHDLRRELGAALEKLANSFWEKGELMAAIDYAQQRLALDFLHEPSYRQLMALYMAAGRRTDALRLYGDLTDLLDKELGVAPEAKTDKLYQQIATGTWQDDPRQGLVQARDTKNDDPAGLPMAVRRPQSISTNLPLPSTPFIGREPELQSIGQLLKATDLRLITLLGPGGSGKTRLAIESARRNAFAFSDGVSFVPLAPLSTPESLLPAVAQSVRLSFVEGEENRREQLLNFLRAKRMLIVMDNFEHMLSPESVALPIDILASAPGVKIMTTSRTRLNVQGEQLYPVLGMRTPAPEQVIQWREPKAEIEAYSALNLFQQRARLIKPDFSLNQDNLAPVTHICQLVEGMPLAIELAVTWLELLSPAEIATEIERSLDFLASEQQDLPSRQRSLRAVFESSWQLLNDLERRAFSRLALFRGGFTREAAEAVAGASLQALLGLTHKSWLRRAADGRYDLHELLRQYAEEKLQKNPVEYQEARQQHADYFSGWMNNLFERLLDPQHKQTLNAIGPELENIRAAWRWYLQRRQYQPIVEAILPGLYISARLHSQEDEIKSLLRQTRDALEKEQNSEESRIYLACILTAYVGTLVEEWEPGLITENLEKSWELAAEWQPDGLEKMGYWYVELVILYSWIVNRPAGKSELRHLYGRLKEANDNLSLVLLCHNLAGMLTDEHKFEEASRLYQEAEQISTLLDIPVLRAYVLKDMASLELRRDNYEAALDILQIGLRLLTTPNNGVRDQPQTIYQSSFLNIIGWIFFTMADIYLQLGELEQAYQYYERQQAVFERAGNLNAIATSIHWQSLFALRYQDPQKALTLRRQLMERIKDTNYLNQIAWCTWEFGEIYRVTGEFEQAQNYYKDAMDKFKARDDQMGIGFYHRGLGDVALAQGKLEEAEEHFEAYLEIAQQERYLWSAAYAHNGLGWVLTKRGDVEGARSEFAMALYLAHDQVTKDLCMLPLAGLAHLLAKIGELTEATALATFVIDQKLTWNETRQEAEEVILQTSRFLDEETFAKAIQEGQALTLSTCMIHYSV